MLHVSMGALVSLVIIMLVCFVLPLPLYYLLFRYAECKAKTLGIGAVAYIICGVVLDTVTAMLLEQFAGLNSNGLLYLLYAAVLSPVIFITFNYFVIKRFGRDNMRTTGDTMMYSLGYGSVCNILSTGIVAAMYFFTLLDIRNRGGVFHVVSDADYVSASSTVSGSDLVTESLYNQMKNLCAEPISYYVMFIINCLWVLAAYAAVFMVLWLAVKKINKPVILAFAFVIRLFIVLPDIMNRFKVIENVWISELISVVILVIVWMAALYCRKSFIDSEDAEEN